MYEKTILLLTSVLLLTSCSSEQVNEPIKSNLKESINLINSSIVSKRPMDKGLLMHINELINEYNSLKNKNSKENKVLSIFSEYVYNCNTESGIENIDIQYCKNRNSELNKLLR